MADSSALILSNEITIVIMVLITLVNLGLVALCFKLYTEILKDQSQNRRANKEKAG